MSKQKWTNIKAMESQWEIADELDLNFDQIKNWVIRQRTAAAAGGGVSETPRLSCVLRSPLAQLGHGPLLFSDDLILKIDRTVSLFSKYSRRWNG